MCLLHAYVGYVSLSLARYYRAYKATCYEHCYDCLVCALCMLTHDACHCRWRTMRLNEFHTIEHAIDKVNLHEFNFFALQSDLGTGTFIMDANFFPNTNG